VMHHIQAEAFSASSLAKGKGTFGSLVMIARQQGWRQLFAGLSINYLKVRSYLCCTTVVYFAKKIHY
jgi:hypothetical protein